MVVPFGTTIGLGHLRRGTNAKPEVDAWIAAQRLNRLAQALQPWVDVKKRLALKEATDAQVCGLAIGTGSERRKALDSH